MSLFCIKDFCFWKGQLFLRFNTMKMFWFVCGALHFGKEADNLLIWFFFFTDVHSFVPWWLLFDAEQVYSLSIFLKKALLTTLALPKGFSALCQVAGGFKWAQHLLNISGSLTDKSYQVIIVSAQLLQTNAICEERSDSAHMTAKQ